MPELPEVETVVGALRPSLVGRTIVDFRNYWPRHVATPTPEILRERIVGCRVTHIWRRAKYIVIDLTHNETLIVHLRMSGHLSVAERNTAPDKHVHTIFGLENGTELRFRDTRKFGKVYLVEDPNSVLGKLGPEPLTDAFTVEVLAERIHGRKRALKPLLLEQSVIAGIGNIYADEALFHAGIMPTRPANSLQSAELTRLHTAIRHVLQLGIDREGASIDSYVLPTGEKGDMQNAVLVFRRTGAPCYTCGTMIERMVLGQRSTHYCPVCQA